MASNSSFDPSSVPLGWDSDGKRLRRVFTFRTFVESIAFVNRVAELAEAANHHPDIDIRWCRVAVESTTHDTGGLTERDTSLAIAVDSAYRSFG